VKAVLAVASPGVFLAARFATAGVVLGALALVRRERTGPGFARHALLLGAFMLAGFELQTLGLRHTTPSRSAFLTGLAVLLVPFITRFALGRRVRASAWAGVVLAALGVLFLTRPYEASTAGLVRLGDALSAGCAVAFALQLAFTSEWSRHHPLLPLTLVEILVTFLGAVATLPLEGPYFHAAGTPRFVASVLYLGVPMTAGAFLVVNWAQRRTSAVRAALIFSLEPVAAALFSHLYGGEPLALLDWVGGAFIVLGIVVGEVGGALEGRAEARAA
jgi:drug/metabolite transporter (DMT)-like permease